MTSALRRRLAALLAGVAGSLVALLVVTWVRQDACLDAGGRWDAALRACDGAAPTEGGAWLFGALAGVATTVVLWRAFTFFVARRAIRR